MHYLVHQSADLLLMAAPLVVTGPCSFVCSSAQLMASLSARFLLSICVTVCRLVSRAAPEPDQHSLHCLCLNRGSCPLRLLGCILHLVCLPLQLHPNVGLNLHQPERVLQQEQLLHDLQQHWCMQTSQRAPLPVPAGPAGGTGSQRRPPLELCPAPVAGA
jgi:hypothetical protein